MLPDAPETPAGPAAASTAGDETMRTRGQSSKGGFAQSPLTPDQSLRKRKETASNEVDTPPKRRRLEPENEVAPVAASSFATPPKRRRVDGGDEPPATPHTPARTAHAPRTPRTPSRTPRTPARPSADLGCFAKFVLESPGPPITPSRFHRSGVDALDALAAVASNTPRSPAVQKSAIGTPCSTATKIAAWLLRVTDAHRQDVQKMTRNRALRGMIDDADWDRITGRLTRLLRAYEAVRKGMPLPERKEETLSVYFATLEAILTREKKRGGDSGVSFVNKLVWSDNFHACLLSCALETVAAVYGLVDMSTINAALSAFSLSAYELTKAISSFARQLPECPRVIAKHLITCEQRYVEAIVWVKDSDLVKYLSERPSKSTTTSVISGTVATGLSGTSASAGVEERGKGERKGEDTISEHKVSKEAKKTDAEPTSERGAPSEENKEVCNQKPSAVKPVSPGRLSVKDLTLQLFYKKLLYIAQERMLELLAFLNLQVLEQPVFTIIKHAVWEKWHLLVDRHLDQIILCAIYGVAKVRKHSIMFKTIISHYQNASHLQEVTFKSLLPGVFKDISLKARPSSPSLPPRKGAAALERGDIIKLYNLVFMPTMKPYLLQLSQQRDENVSTGVHSTGTIRANSETATRADSTSLGRGDKADPVSMSVLQSPLRPRRQHPSPRRIGNVTVSPMSPRVRPLFSLRQSPSIRHSPMYTSMTPISRTLYAFGESPVRTQSAAGRHVPVPLSFSRSTERTASIRRTFVEAFSNKPRSSAEPRSSSRTAGQRPVE